MKRIEVPAHEVPRHQGGAVLQVALVLLAVMTLMAANTTDILSLHSQLLSHQVKSNTLQHLARNELQAQFERMKHPAWRQQVLPLQAPTNNPSGTDSRQLDPADFITPIDTQRYQREGSIILTGVERTPVPGYSLNQFLVRQYQISINVQATNNGQSSHQILGIAHIELAN